ncbi:MAG: ribosomal protein S18-alanine N-acetyltransferase [Tissierellia bacterium]|nr:ribosomal protein S18-alanine N-acetyltransferase [Tissierellia bacterium]
MEVHFRPMEEADVPQVHEIEKRSFTTPWSRQGILKEITENKLAKYLVMIDTQSNAIIGYFGLWVVGDEGHIMNIAIHEDYRGKGLGNLLLDQLIGLAKEHAVNRLTLEVRRTNEVAIGLYEKHGFEVSAIRKGYYRDVGEDAYIMWLELEEH